MPPRIATARLLAVFPRVAVFRIAIRAIAGARVVVAIVRSLVGGCSRGVRLSRRSRAFARAEVSPSARRRAVATSRALDATSFSNNTALDFFRSVSYGFGPNPVSPFAFPFPPSRRAAFPRVVARLRSRAVVVFFPPARVLSSHSPVIIPSVARAASYRDRADPAVARAASVTSDASSSSVARAVGIARDDSRFES